MQHRPDPNAPRRMTRQEYEAHRRQNIIAIAIMAGIAVVLVVAVVLILRPKPAKDSSAAPVVETVEAGNAEPTAEPSTDSGSGSQIPDLEAMTDTEPSSESADSAGGTQDSAAAQVTAVPQLPQAIDHVVSTRPPDGSLRSVRMRVVGDIMFCQSQLEYARDTNYDFHPQFEMIAEQLADADYTMGNMEGTIGKYKKSSYSGYPMFNAPEVALAPLKDDGIDFLTLANNHMLDRWSGGVTNTVNAVEKYGFDHVGAYRNKSEFNGTVVCEVGGIKFGFLAYTHTTNSMENRGVDKEAVDLVPYLRKADFESDVKKLRAAGAEVIIAFPHWGAEYVREPDSEQKKYAKRLAQAGVDIIIGSHAHMVQPMGYQTVTVDGREKKVFTMFCMGNFISDHVVQYTDNGIILDFTVNEQADGTFTCDSVGYIPTYTWKQDGAIKVLPSGRYLKDRPSGMDDENYNRMVASYYEIAEVIGDQFQLING